VNYGLLVRFSFCVFCCFLFYLTKASLFVIGLVIFYVLFGCCLGVSTSEIDCLKRLISGMTFYVLSGTLNSTH